MDDIQKRENDRLINYDTALKHYENGKAHMSRKDWNSAISDFQAACSLTEGEDDDVREEFCSSLRKACKEKQSSQNLDERMIPYAQLIEKIKNEPSKPIYKIAALWTEPSFITSGGNFLTKEEYAEIAAAFAFFEEYELLDRYIKEGSGSERDKFNYMILNQIVRPQFSWREPTPLSFITSKESWEKMKDPKRMLEHLIKKGADFNFLDADDNTPLSIAQEENLTEAENILIEHGALLPDEMKSPDDDGRHDGWS